MKGGTEGNDVEGSGAVVTARISQQAEDRYTDILGLRVSAIDMPSAIKTIEGWIVDGTHRYVCICTVHTVMECQRNPGLLDVVNGAGLRTPDGMPLVWLSRRAGHRDVARVYGPDLMLALCARSKMSGHRHFFYGGAPGVADELARRLQMRFPGLKVAGTHTPPALPIGAVEDATTIRRINEAAADVVWVGLGNPKQEWWVANHRRLLDAPVLIAVGAAFDFHTGRIRQAPRWMQRNGLEWVFRLSQDPHRLWKRYLVCNSQFVAKVFRERVTTRFSLTRTR
ncbi:MAG: N-acetylglucosaminyldiphosphoundecaprenol N-acetyl-beta-D-mannosaminyltransferase [Thermomicrobiales bacterium]|nr:N-acetylglucosaminyldiphosphoundecaprenol N-acetyl-beta-D-mannosaminyltransferase [Thermomicrobiales bacterium]